MKKVSVVLVVCALFILPARAQKKKVLFIGNSFFASNNLPLLVDSLSIMSGDTLEYQSVLTPGAGLKEHCSNAAVFNAIRSQIWDYVIMHDQSQRPCFEYEQVVADVKPYAKQLVDSIRKNNACTIPVFFSTWGYKDGDPQWDSINTFLKMNTRLYNTYTEIAQENATHLIAGGWAFDAVREPNTGSVSFGELYQPDGRHPSIYGSYLSACLIYSHIFGKKSKYNSFRPNDMPSHYTEYLQDMADLTTSYYAKRSNYFPFAKFDYENNEGSKAIVITDKTIGGYAHYWLFSDGFSSTAQNPTHIFDTFGTFAIGQYVKNDCGYFDTTIVYVNVVDKIMNTIGKQAGANKVYLYPNPCSNYISVSENNEIQSILSLDGKILIEYSQATKLVEIAKLPHGVYIAETKLGKIKFIKQ